MSDEDDIPREALLAQVAALPYRVSSGALEILLITSRDSGRWLIPKGWGMKNRTPSQAAEVEAFEEAGVSGAIAKQPVGEYTYAKTLKDGTVAACRVDVFPLAVKRLAKKWKEKGQRHLQWMTQAEAAERVAESELARLIADFRPDHAPKP